MDAESLDNVGLFGFDCKTACIALSCKETQHIIFLQVCIITYTLQKQVFHSNAHR